MKTYQGTTAQPKRQSKKLRKRYPTLTIICHPDPGRIGDRAILKGSCFRLARGSMDFVKPNQWRGQPLNDPYLSRGSLFIKTSAKGDLSIERGDFRSEAWIGANLLGETTRLSAAQIQAGVPICLSERIVLWLHEARDQQLSKADQGLIGASDLMVDVREDFARIADLNNNILIRGPSGSGKELVAKAIHDGAKKHAPFVAVNMGALLPNLAQAELFGAVRGSFTGSVRDQLGYFRAAHGGTLFLDEIGETPPEIQAMLLRALETGEVVPVGSQTAVPVSFRIIAATDADLEALIREQSFKNPLFHRLSGYTIHLPSLADRLEDFGRLFLHFAREALVEIGRLDRLDFKDPFADPWIPAPLMMAFLAYDWPGNVRQLRNVTHQLVIGSRHESQLQMSPAVSAQLQLTAKKPVEAQRRKPRQLSEAELVESLKTQRWDIKAAAQALGISRASLYALIDKVPGIRKASDLTSKEIAVVLEQTDGDLEATAEALEVSAKGLRRRVKALGLQG